MFDTNDSLLIYTILDKYTNYINDCMKKTLEYKLNFIPGKRTEIIAIKNGIETQHNFITIGFYHKDKNEFKFEKSINEILLNHILKKYDVINIFGSESTIKKLFKETVKMNFKEHTVIPCLISIFHPAFNIVKFEFTDKKNVIMYAMIKLNIKCKLDYDQFLYEMSIMKSFCNFNKTKTSKKKTSKKKTSKKKTSKNN